LLAEGYLMKNLPIAVVLVTFLLLTPSVGIGQFVEFQYAPSPADNPLRGLVPYARPVPDRFPHSMEFQYLALGELVVGRGEFDFRPLERLLDDVASRGNQTVFRIMLEYPGRKNLIPQFLIDAGLTVHRYENTNTAPWPPKPVETPDYENLLLRETLQEFIRELGRRYDGDPRIGYITAGLLGTWGEWHTHPRSDLWASKEVQREVLDAYQQSFQKTPVLLRYPAGEDDLRYAPTHTRPFGYHDDSFAYATLTTGRRSDSWFFQARLIKAHAQDTWKRFPIGGEIRPEVWGCCFDDPPCTPEGQSFAQCRDATHVTWLMDTGMFRRQASPERMQRALDQVRRMGYEFHVKSFQRQIQGDRLLLTLEIHNTGIAPFYHPGWAIELAALDADGAVLVGWSTDWSLLGILPDQQPAFWKMAIAQNEIPREKAELCLRVIHPLTGGKPLRFANREQDRLAPGWLSLGSMPGD
jgi:hypothetical protein